MASGKLSTSDMFVTDVKTQATARLAADKASLPALEKGAFSPAWSTFSSYLVNQCDAHANNHHV
jgi:hypothetical protein